MAGGHITSGRATARLAGSEEAPRSGRTHGGGRRSPGLLGLSKGTERKPKKLTSRVVRSIRRAQRALRSEELHKRKIIDLGESILGSCRMVVSDVHSGRMSAAEHTLKKSGGDFRRFLALVRVKHHLQQWGYALQVVQEYLEASLLLAVCTGKELFPLNELDRLPDVAILYGTSDLIGELRRNILASLATERIEDVKRTFDVMSDLYGELSAVSLSDSVAPGLRRKLDVNRSMLESTLSDLTEEISRRNLTRSMNQLASRLQCNK